MGISYGAFGRHWAKCDACGFEEEVELSAELVCTYWIGDTRVFMKTSVLVEKQARFCNKPIYTLTEMLLCATCKRGLTLMLVRRIEKPVPVPVPAKPIFGWNDVVGCRATMHRELDRVANPQNANAPEGDE